MRTSLNGISAIVRDFPLSYFSAVMATGIVASAANAWGQTLLAHALFGIACALYIIFVVISIWRLIVTPSGFFSDLQHEKTGIGSLALVAGTCVLGAGFVSLFDQLNVAYVLWAIGFILWVVLLYWFFAIAIAEEPKPGLEKGLNGAWLLVVVSTQSVSVLGMAKGGELLWHPLQMLFCLGMFLLGLFLYIPLISLIFYRWMFLPVKPEALTPPYWINMGALAITTLAGANLILAAPRWELLSHLVVFIEGITLLAWAVATWWLPLLLIIGVWRHIIQKYPLRYDQQYWSMVFPLGMYSFATFHLARAMHIEMIKPISAGFAVIAVLVWLIVFIGFLRHLKKDEQVEMP
ncbi:MAG: tellurite resistance/C4-dicarboxylate transporter family protein [Chthoniobacterales bacterium]